jgi:hypothetical protein
MFQNTHNNIRRASTIARQRYLTEQQDGPVFTAVPRKHFYEDTTENDMAVRAQYFLNGEEFDANSIEKFGRTIQIRHAVGSGTPDLNVHQIYQLRYTEDDEHTVLCTETNPVASNFVVVNDTVLDEYQDELVLPISGLDVVNAADIINLLVEQISESLMFTPMDICNILKVRHQAWIDHSKVVYILANSDTIKMILQRSGYKSSNIAVYNVPDNTTTLYLPSGALPTDYTEEQRNQRVLSVTEVIAANRTPMTTTQYVAQPSTKTGHARMVNPGYDVFVAYF